MKEDRVFGFKKSITVGTEWDVKGERERDVVISPFAILRDYRALRVG